MESKKYTGVNPVPHLQPPHSYDPSCLVVFSDWRILTQAKSHVNIQHAVLEETGNKVRTRVVKIAKKVRIQGWLLGYGHSLNRKVQDGTDTQTTHTHFRWKQVLNALGRVCPSLRMLVQTLGEERMPLWYWSLGHGSLG